MAMMSPMPRSSAKLITDPSANISFILFSFLSLKKHPAGCGLTYTCRIFCAVRRGDYSENDSLANLSTDVSSNYATKTDLSNYSLTHGAATGTNNVEECSVNCDYNNEIAFLTGLFVGKAGSYTQGQTLFTLPITLTSKTYVWFTAIISGTICYFRVRSNGIVEFNTSTTITGKPYVFINAVVPR